jgi:creatinine deaminase
MLIRIDDLQGPKIVAMLEEHLDDMHSASPEESCHALDLEGLRKPNITFWTVWDGVALMGCGALKELDPGHAEIKSMRTAAAFRGRGVAAAMMGRILEEAAGRGYSRLSLETGAGEFFAPARALYEKFGFVACPPFADYTEDPNSHFMTRELSGRTDMDPFLLAAIEEAELGLAEGGIPIGSVLVHDGVIVGRGHNRRVQRGSTILHAEMDALENAGRRPAKFYRESTLYTTLSPCSMCSGAIVLYGIPRVVVGENKSFMGEEVLLAGRGVDIEVVQDERCIGLMRDFMAARPDLWAEDIGE